MSTPIVRLAIDEPPRRVLDDARAAFGVVSTGRILRLVGRVDADHPSREVVDPDEDRDDVLMFRDDDIVIFLWHRRVPGGSRISTELFGNDGIATAGLRRPSHDIAALTAHRPNRFDSDTLPTGPASLVLDMRSDGVAKTWQSDWVML